MDMSSYNNWKKHHGHAGKCAVTWTDSDLLTLPWKITYQIDEIPPEDNWDTFATHNKLATEAMYKAWGVPKEGGKHYMSIRPRLTKGLSSLISPYTDKRFNYNFLKLPSGCQLMWHFDTYATFVKFNNITEKEYPDVCRTAIMLQDWDRGQMLQVGDNVYTHWKAGDTFTWKGDVWHGMCNFGPSDCVIGQITFLDENNEYTQDVKS